ncbi:hypothetical protein GCM10011375_40770 [Hymenobacter qilianensis]|uniref:Uncharacterized protein n=2 Tax=Hymenobacter qilianensis TaxID=1385715 RepID=A0ACB5PXD1_9BACT|nr:hypothetical protein [Hymenobacter qilianensis]QNP54535.1 hypothetical protein H9L05_22760 [Hymenobacter qilianensis]GGF81639.1 hypothetical protein GCM10011375_40770 [Hymenobacter qilianensis]
MSDTPDLSAPAPAGYTPPTEPCSFPNLTDRELDRDVVNLFLPEIDLFATDEELAAMYPPGDWARMQRELDRQ